MPSCLHMLLVALLTTSGTALASPPTSDRPTLTDRATLVAAGELEAESGVSISEGAVTIPTLLKYAPTGRTEARLGADLRHFGQGVTGLSAGAKISILHDSAIQVSTLLETALPVGRADVWYGEALALVDIDADGVIISANTGLEFSGVDGLGLAGVPLRGSIDAPLRKELSIFGELSSVVRNGTFTNVLGDVGVRLRLTSIAHLDTFVGFEPASSTAFFGAGFTANLGRIGG